MRTRKLACPSCKKPFRPGGPWPAPDPELPTAKQTSERFEIGRNFANKLWNAARFLLLNLDGYTPAAIRMADLPVEDRWILSRLASTAAQVTEHFEAYHFSDAARTLYDFTWSEFCDWYVEMSKSRLKEPATRPLAQRVLAGVLDAILRLLQPIMPFVTESIWQALAEAAFERGLPNPEPADESVMIAPWPALPKEWQESATEKRMARMQDLVRAVRNIRNEFKVNERATVDVAVRCEPAVAADFALLKSFILPLAKVGTLACGPSAAKPPQSAATVHADFEAYVDLRGLIDVPAEIKRLEKQQAEKEKQLQGVRGKLANANFLKNAPEDVVAQQRGLEYDLLQQVEAIQENLRQLRAS
jgi:valyl-tRNA synthetase